MSYYSVEYLGGDKESVMNAGIITNLETGEKGKICDLEEAKKWRRLFQVDEDMKWKFVARCNLSSCISYLTKKGNIT